jgi:AcrR family transcriptional regulator
MAEAMATGSAETQAGRNARRRAESRSRLLNAARRLFVERGYHATRPADIARAAGVATGTFYLYFADKRDVFLAFVDEAAGEVQSELTARMEGLGGFEARLYAALDAILDYSRSNPGVLRAAFADTAIIAPDEAATPTLRDRLAGVLAAGLRNGMSRGEMHDDYDPDLIAYAVVGMLQQACARWLETGGDRDPLLRNLTSFCSRALLRYPKETR